MRWYVSDFETTSEKFYNLYGYTKVWLWSICDSSANIIEDGDNISTFLARCKRLAPCTMYFHNLKFDGSFILSYLLDNGIPYVPKTCTTYPYFDCLIDDMGAWYTVSIHFSKTRVVKFCDSLKLLPFKAEKIAEDFMLPILKGKIDYEDYVINSTTLEYIHHDVQIIAYALSELKANKIDKLTIASSAYHYYSSLFNENVFNMMYPKLDTDFLATWRLAYRGGRSQCNMLHQNKVLTNVNRYDINSMYPYIMHDMPLPYGEPIPCSPGTYRFELYHIRIDFVLKEDHMPTLLNKASAFYEDSYYTTSDGIIDIYISSVDLEIMKRHYVIFSLEYLECYGFNTTRILFKEYVDYWYNVKNTTTGAKRIIAKLMLNSLYGKFGSNIYRSNKLPYLDSDLTLSFNNSEPEEGKHFYLPIAIAIVSYAHMLIDDAITLTGYENFVYCDTDSVHTLGTLPADLVDNIKLGKFKLEAVEEKAKYVRQKTYITKEDGKYHITCAGLPEEGKELYISTHDESNILKEFKSGLTVPGKKMPIRVKGGTILHETTFTIK